MATDKKRVQGYLSDTAYQYLEDYRIENGLKSQSLALEKLLESLAVKGSESDLESESYSKLKSELLNDLTSKLESMISERLGNGNNSIDQTHDSNQNDPFSDLSLNDKEHTGKKDESNSNYNFEADIPNLIEVIRGYWCVICRDGKYLKFWDGEHRERSGYKASIYKSEKSAKVALNRAKKTIGYEWEVWQCDSLVHSLAGSTKNRTLSLLEENVRIKKKKQSKID